MKQVLILNDAEWIQNGKTGNRDLPKLCTVPAETGKGRDSRYRNAPWDELHEERNQPIPWARGGRHTVYNPTAFRRNQFTEAILDRG